MHSTGVQKGHKAGSRVELESLKHKWQLFLCLSCLAPQFLSLGNAFFVMYHRADSEDYVINALHGIL